MTDFPEDTDVISDVVGLFRVILMLLRAGKDRTAQEEALMTGQEVIKAGLDRRKFSDDDSEPGAG